MSIYLLTGIIFMAVLDLFHSYLLKRHPDMIGHEGYDNYDRFFIMLFWPYFIISLIFTITANKNK